MIAGTSYPIDGPGMPTIPGAGVFRWTEQSGMQSLGTLNNGTFSYGRPVRADVLALGPPPRTDETLWLTVTGTHQAGNADTERGYFNAGTADRSLGSSRIPAYRIRIRFDWLSAVRIGSATVTPYLDLSRMRSERRGYTKTGGDFPAALFDRGSNSTEAHIGGVWSHALRVMSRLRVTIEGVHRFEDTGPTTSGCLLSLFSFGLPGVHLRQNWLRLATTLQKEVGHGQASFRVNATTFIPEP